MKYSYIVLFLFFIFGITHAQTLPGVLFRDSIYPDYLFSPGVVYGSNVNYLDSNETLTMDIYQPLVGPSIKRPLMIMVHGGGFTEGNQLDLAFFCVDFTARGYVTATINYRVGLPFKADSEQFVEEVYRVAQDTRAAERYLKANASAYCIDTNYIFLAGTSAGSIAILNTAWWKQSNVPSYIDTILMGTLDNADNNSRLSSRITGVLNCWGAVTDSSIITANPPVSVISFVGDSDKTIPPDDGYINISDSVQDAFIYGSYFIDEKLQRLGVPQQLKIFPGVGHGLSIGDPLWDTIINYTSKFFYNNYFQNYKPTGCNDGVAEVNGPSATANHNEITIVNNAANIIQETKFYDIRGQKVMDITTPIYPSETFYTSGIKWTSGIYFAYFIFSDGTHQTVQLTVVNE